MSKLAQRVEQAVTKYDPDTGVKTVRFLEAAEKHWAKAKDADKLQAAIRAKLEAQAEFVFWWDTAANKDPGASMKRGVRSVTAFDKPQDYGLDKTTISRWRSKLNDPAKFEQSYEAACHRYLKVIEFQSSPHVTKNSGENEWYTPAEHIEAARQAMGGIDLDPATSETANTIVQAAEVFTADTNGLEQRWDGRVWLNPPYAQPLIEQFCQKLADSVRAGTVTEACVLVNNATETQWFRTLVDVGSAICFPTGRIRFWSPSKESAAPLQGQAVVYVGADATAFLAAFSGFGFVVRIERPV